MSLDVILTADRPTEVFSANITHNMTRMADEAGIYKCLWRPDEIEITKSAQLVEPLKAGIALMESDPERFKFHNPKNGWGDYYTFLKWCKNYLQACEDNPDAEISVNR